MPRLPHQLPDRLNVLVMMDEVVPVRDIEAVAPGRVVVHQGPPGAFADAAGLHPPPTGLWKGRPWRSDLSPEEREELLLGAHVLVFTLPYPKRLYARAPNLIWVHYAFAGASDLHGSDLWGVPVTVTTSRGWVDAGPIAEMVIGAALLFAKDLSVAVRQTALGELDAAPYHLMLLEGRTMGIIGLGGLGRETARRARALGMRVIATRRSATRRQQNVEGVDVLYPSAELHLMLGECDFVAVTPMLTPETEHMLDASAFARMKDGAYVLNVARGEVIDEDALKDALRSGKLGGAYLDVYTDEWTRLPDPELMALPNVVMTPHNSGLTDVAQSYAMDLFADNLRRLLADEPLVNEIDWNRGY